MKRTAVAIEAEAPDRFRGRPASFYLPFPRSQGSAPNAVWLYTANLAKAAGRVLGAEPTIHCPTGALTANDVLDYATPKQAQSSAGRFRYVPLVAKTLAKDVRRALQALHVGPELEHAKGCAFVWQYHNLFFRNGRVAARRSALPFVLHVDAPVVWEAERWGVKRPGWGPLLESFVEGGAFRQADVIACPSAEVAEQVKRIEPTASPLVTPAGVDTDLFEPRGTRDETRKRLGLAERIVVGWTGSFRSFHGVETLISEFALAQRERPELALLLVGDGLARPRVEERVRTSGADGVVLTGTVPHDAMPELLEAMDFCAVSPPPGEAGFHYSPMKLREYLAMERRAVAPHTGEIARVFSADLVTLYDHSSPGTLASTLVQLADIVATSGPRLAAAREFVRANMSWDENVRRILSAAYGCDVGSL